MDMGLQGKVAIVTGATANIGRAIALDLASEGARLIAIGRDEEAGARVVAEARERGAADAHFLAIDLLEPDACERIARFAATTFGGVDVLVNNVGGNVAAGLFAESEPATWQKDIDITLGTVLGVTRAILPLMIGRGGGRIVNLGSTAGTVGDYMLSVYSAAKGAVHAFTRVLAKEVGVHDITVNCVAPYGTLASDPAAFSSGSRFHPEHGFFRQAFAGVDPAERAKMSRSGPLRRTFATPEEVAGAVLYLASSRAGFITGQILHVDGGTLL
ncbi:MAG TPA: SDR family NAD(P)-dependent oxidoreductase [Pseudomonadales bacterium]|nr:SDR family NAD(P)-dependent oxidoreductase [Pseudomonadales bacterium]